MKQAKEDEKKEAKAAKKAAKEAQEADKKGDADEKTKKPAGGRKRKTNQKDDDDQPAEGGDSEKPKKEAKRRGKAEEKQRDVDEPEDVDMVPEPKAKAKAKAKAKRGAKSKVEKVEKEEPKPKAKAKAARKAKAKPVPKDEEPKKDVAEEESESEMAVATPKKQLFQSSEDESEEESAHKRIVKKTGEVKPLDQVFEEDLPSQWKRSKGAVPEPAASSAAGPEEPKRPKKPSKATLSPLAKKLAKKRRKAVDDTMREQLTEDKSLQGIFYQHLKAVSGKPFDDVKKYLLSQGPKDCGKFVLDPYWGRTACGVKAKELGNGGKKTLPLVAYFASFGTAPDWNTNMSLVYLSAWLMATWLIIFIFHDVSRCSMGSQVHQLPKPHGTTLMLMQ